MPCHRLAQLGVQCRTQHNAEGTTTKEQCSYFARLQFSCCSAPWHQAAWLERAHAYYVLYIVIYCNIYYIYYTLYAAQQLTCGSPFFAAMTSEFSGTDVPECPWTGSSLTGVWSASCTCRDNSGFEQNDNKASARARWISSGASREQQDQDACDSQLLRDCCFPPSSTLLPPEFCCLICIRALQAGTACACNARWQTELLVSTRLHCAAHQAVTA